MQGYWRPKLNGGKPLDYNSACCLEIKSVVVCGKRRGRIVEKTDDYIVVEYLCGLVKHYDPRYYGKTKKKRKKIKWTEQMKKDVRECYETMGVEFLAEQFDISCSAVKSQFYKMK